MKKLIEEFEYNGIEIEVHSFSERMGVWSMMLPIGDAFVDVCLFTHNLDDIALFKEQILKFVDSFLNPVYFSVDKYNVKLIGDGTDNYLCSNIWEWELANE